jgi:hypothetical protein
MVGVCRSMYLCMQLNLSRSCFTPSGHDLPYAGWIRWLLIHDCGLTTMRLHLMCMHDVY